MSDTTNHSRPSADPRTGRLRQRHVWCLLLMSLAAGACGSDGSSSASADPFCQDVLPRVDAYIAQAAAANPTPDDERYGGTVVVGEIGELPDGMMSVVTNGRNDRSIQMFVHLMPLLRYDEAIEPQPYLAESWEVSPDNSEITFQLRQDVYWHDGERTDAHDVAFTYRAITDPATGWPIPGDWLHYDKSEAGLEVIDDFTVRVRLDPHLDFLDVWTYVGILPEHLLGEVPHAELQQHPFGSQCPVGNGPFVFTSHAPQDRWVFSANPAFPEALGGRPFIDRYIYRIIPEQTTLLAELLTGGIDLYNQPPPDQATQIGDSPGLELITFDDALYVFVAWNSRRPQLADPRVRRALTLATNRAEIIASTYQGFGSVANSGVPPAHWAFDPSIHEAVEHDPDGARALLDEAGWIDRDGDGVRENPEGLPLSISIKYNTGNQQRQDVAEIMQSQLGQVGVEVTPQVVEWATLFQQINTPGARDFDGVVMGFGTGFKFIDREIFHSAVKDQPLGYAGTDNARIDEFLDRILAQVDREAALPLVSEYQRLIVEESPFTFLHFPVGLVGASESVRGLRVDARGLWAGIRDWYIDPESRR